MATTDEMSVAVENALSKNYLFVEQVGKAILKCVNKHLKMRRKKQIARIAKYSAEYLGGDDVLARFRHKGRVHSVMLSLKSLYEALGMLRKDATL